MARILNKKKFKEQIITVIGEGITEQYYFKHVRTLYNYRFNVRPYFFSITSLINMEQKIIEVLEGNGIAICVFDADVYLRNKAENFKFDLLHKKFHNEKNVIFCDSMPSIEFWFLIHYLNTCRHFNDAKAAERDLRKHLPQYLKKARFLESEAWVKELCSDDKLETAINRSKKFGITNPSYSNIYKAFELFKEQRLK